MIPTVSIWTWILCPLDDGYNVWLEANDVSAIEESYQTPNRIHIRSQSPDIVLTDYAFPEETELDVKERIRDIFSLDLQDNIVYAEDLPRKTILLLEYSNHMLWTFQS